MTQLMAQNQQCESLIPHNIFEPNDFTIPFSQHPDAFCDGHVAPWKSSHGSPDVRTGSGCNGTENCCDGHYAHVYTRWIYQPFSFESEGFFYEANLCKDQEYDLSFCWASGANPPPSENESNCNTSFIVRALPSGLSNACSSYSIPQIAGGELLTSLPFGNNEAWSTHSKSFTLSDDATQIWFYPTFTQPFPQTNCLAHFNFDNPVLTCDTRLDMAFSSELVDHPYVIQFTDLSSFVGGAVYPVAWRWFFGDGECSDEQHPLHAYAAPGEYEICLEVIDNCGCTGVVCQTIIVTSCDCEGFLHITENTVWDTDQTISQHIVIEPGVRLDINNSVVRLLRDCKVLVKRNARLNVVNSWLSGSQCGVPSDFPFPWGGIQIWGTRSQQHPPSQVITSDLTYLDTNQGIAYVSGGGLIHQEDTHGGAGVLAAGPSWPFSNMLPNGGAGGEWSNHFGGIAITDNNASIINCRRGFDLQKWPVWPHLGWQTASYARNTSFVATRSGVWNQQDGFSVSGCTFINNDLVQGTRSIQNMDARISVVKSSFTRIDQAINHIYTLAGFPLPVYIGSLDNANDGNTFFNCKLGIYGIGGGDIFIGNNSFERSSSVDPWYSGVHIDGEANFIVRDNDFKKQWIGLINQSTLENFGYGDINCNRYFDSEYGQLNFGHNNIYLRNEDFDNSQKADVQFVHAQNYPMHCPPQGASQNAVWNYFSPQIPDHNFISPFYGNSFYYYYPENAPTQELIPRCALYEFPLAPGCLTSSVHINDQTPGGAFNCTEHDPNDPEYCEDTDCLDSIRLAIGQDLLLIDGDDTDGLLSSLSTWPSSITTYQDLLAASPYLSDTVLKEVILAATMNDTHRMDILMANAPLNAPVWNMVLSHLDSAAMISLLGVSGPSDRYILETKLHDLSYLYWSSVRHLAFDSLSGTNYPAKAALLNSLPEPEALRMRYGMELTLGLYTQAATTLQALPTSMAAWSDLQEVNLDRIRDPHYSLDSSRLVLLESWEEDKGANGALARGLLVILDDRMYFPDFEEEATPRFAQAGNSKSVAPTGGLMRLAPNPAGAEVTVWSGYDMPDPQGRLRVYDMRGQLVLEQSGIQPVQTLFTGHLPPGIYLVALEGSFSSDRQKLVIR
jgi:PKD repeat protein